MPENSHLTQSSAMARVHDEISLQGYAITSERDVGLPEKCGWEFRENYFNSGELRHDPGDFPVDRERARDVIRYQWHGDELTLEEYDTIVIHDRSGIKGDRIHKRIELLQNLVARQLVETFIRMVPEDRRQPEGTFGVNMFRTHTDVVTKPHQDNEEFIFLYVLDRVGDGAVSYLYDDDGTGCPGVADDAKPLMWRQLNPGELMVFEDARFKHGATPLVPLATSDAKRDVLVCTIDYPSTYLERDHVAAG
jgi:2OG-Fe dioxygenase